MASRPFYSVNDQPFHLSRKASPRVSPCDLPRSKQSAKFAPPREARGFLSFLEQHGILDAGQRELVVDRAMALDQDEIDLDDLKWVVLMVLFNQPGSEAAYAWMETQMFDGEDEALH